MTICVGETPVWEFTTGIKLRSGFVPERRNSVLERNSKSPQKSNSVPASFWNGETPFWAGVNSVLDQSFKSPQNSTPFRLRSRTEFLRSGTELRFATKIKLRSGFVPERRNSVLERSSKSPQKSNFVPASIWTRATPAWDGNTSHRGDRTKEHRSGQVFLIIAKIEPRPGFVPERRAELARSGSPDRCLTSQHRVRWDEGCA